MISFVSRYIYALMVMGLWMPVAIRAQVGEIHVSAADTLADRYDLEQVVVTGTRTPKLLKNTPIETRLISIDDIRQSDATDLKDILEQEVPGVEFSYAMNQQVNLNMAGFAGQGILILVDGERLAGESMDNVDFSRLSMSGIQHIEIVKGAASALYGSNATGGVINLITRNSCKSWSLNVNGRWGTNREQRYGGTLGLCRGKLQNTFSVAHTRTSTYSVCDDLNDACDFRQVYGYRTWNFADKLVFKPTDALKLTARAGYYFKERAINQQTPDRYRDFSGGLRGVYAFPGGQQLELGYAFDQYDKSDYLRQHQLDVRDYRNVQHSIRALFTQPLREADVLTLGGDVLRDYLDSYQFAKGEHHRQFSADVFAQYDWVLSPRWELVTATRWDYYHQGNHSQFTAKVNACYHVGRITLRGGYASGFRAPTLKEKYMNFDMSGIFDIHGNATLKAETSHNLNLSADYSWGCYRFTWGGHYSRIYNKIGTSSVIQNNQEAPYVVYSNVSNLHVWGMEATAQARWRNGLSLRIGYNYTHEQTKGSGVSPYCPARPHSLQVRLGWMHQWCKGHSSSVQLSGRLHSFVAYNSLQLTAPYESKRISSPAYTLWKLQVAQTLWRGCTLRFTIDNLFNYTPKIYTFQSPATQGIQLQAGVSFDFDSLFLCT